MTEYQTNIRTYKKINSWCETHSILMFDMYPDSAEKYLLPNTKEKCLVEHLIFHIYIKESITTYSKSVS